MSSAAVRAAMVKASFANVSACAHIDQDRGEVWTSAPVADVLNVLEEFERLQEIEASMNRLADAYDANADMLNGIVNNPDSPLLIIAECSSSAARLIRKALNDG